MHPFTGIEITDSGVAFMSDWMGQIREVIGMDVPLASDHFGHIGVNSCIRLARSLEKWNLAWVEDMVPWQFPLLLHEISENTTVPVLTGEDIYLKEHFIKLFDAGAVDMIHPDLASSGGLIETKKIGDYAMEHGVAMAMHFAGKPDPVHGERPFRGRDRKLRGARAPLARRSVVSRSSRRRPASRSSTRASHSFPTRLASAWSRTKRLSAQHLRPGGRLFRRRRREWDKERSWDRTWS